MINLRQTPVGGLTSPAVVAARMADDDATTIGTYFNDRELDDILEPFDEARREYGIDSRSAAIKRAMQAFTVFMELINEQPWDFDAEQSERFWLRQAVRNEIMREISDS